MNKFEINNLHTQELQEMANKIEEFNVFDASREEWKELHKFRIKFHDEQVPEKPFMDDKTYEKVFQSRFDQKDSKSELLIIKNENEVIGIIRTDYELENSPSYKGNEQNMNFFISLLSKGQKDEIVLQALTSVIGIAERANKNNLTSFATIDYEKKYLDMVGAEKALVMRENRSYFKDLDWEMIQNWIKEGKQKNSETKLMIVEEVPDDIVEEYCKTLTFAGNQAPRDRLEGGDFVMTPENYKKNEREAKIMKIEKHIALTLEKNGEVSGLTELMYYTQNNTLSQGLTAVLENYRGRKIGKWLKASLLVHIRNKYKVAYIKTFNAESNDSMLSINTRLGYEKYSELINYQIKLEELKNYISNKTGK